MRKLSLLFAVAAISVFSIGCDNSGTKGASGTTGGSGTTTDDEHGHSHEGEDAHDHGEGEHGEDEHAGHDHSEHGHSELGPNGGHIIDLGHDHEYHAELLDDHKTEAITIFMHDGDLKPMKIAQEKVTLVLTAGGESNSFELTALEEGEGSAFRSEDANMMKMIDSGKAKGKLRVTIKDKPFSGSFVHEAHGHGDHAHGEHAEGEGHDHDEGHAKDHDDHADHDHDHKKGEHDDHTHEGDDKGGK